jgi:enoyl-CoA hydratase/carnithine racemase
MDETLNHANRLPLKRKSLRSYTSTHFQFEVREEIAAITLDRPNRKNPLTFESYGELNELFADLATTTEVHVVLLSGAEGNFCSGGDVHDIIGPLTQFAMPELLAFTRMTGALVQVMRACPQPIVSAIDGVCAGAGAILALASDIRFGTARSKIAFLFNRVGLAGCDMGACALLPRVVGQGRASELLYAGRVLGGEEAERWGFFNRLCTPEELLTEARKFALDLAKGPTFAHAMTKKMLHLEWNMGIDQAIEAEAQAQAICMATNDFHRAYEAFVDKAKPTFKGD